MTADKSPLSFFGSGHILTAAFFGELSIGIF
jgi:hypothetical protein